jgi:hypothetical protein
MLDDVERAVDDGVNAYKVGVCKQQPLSGLAQAAGVAVSSSDESVAVSSSAGDEGNPQQQCCIDW